MCRPAYVGRGLKFPHINLKTKYFLAIYFEDMVYTRYTMVYKDISK